MSRKLTPEERLRLEKLFELAVDLPEGEQPAFVDRECDSNTVLRAELTRLLGGFLGEDHLDELRSPAPSREGSRIGPYELGECIGEGGMGEVYAAEQLEPIVRSVALKIIRLGMDSKQVIARFEAERQALARMTHVNIAQVYDGGTTDDGRPYFVMEHVDGESVTEYCDRHEVSTRGRLELFLQICDGVQHAHHKGIIHRDLKPSNLLVGEQDGRAVPKIIDFGIARATTGSLGEHSLHTMMGQIVGTLDYMSPEQADPGGVDIDTRSDIYSMGVVLYQLLTGLLPFEHNSAAGLPISQIQRALREKVPVTPSTRLRRSPGTASTHAPKHGTSERALIRQLEGDLDWICMRALEKDPERRYASAAEFADDIRRHLTNLPVTARRPSVLYRARKFAARNRGAVIAGALSTVALLVAAFGVISSQLDALANKQLSVMLENSRRVDELEALRAQADELWPAHPERIEGMLEWLSDAREHLSALGGYRVALAEYQPDSASRTPEDQLRVDQLSALIESLELLESRLLAEDGVSDEHGWSIPKRLRFARELQADFAEGTAFSAAWSTTREALHQHPLYDGLDLPLQMGLVPIGADPRSELWEFWCVGTGEQPLRDDAGELAISGTSGIVLVLIPGETFTMGAQDKDPAALHYDVDAMWNENPPHEVSVPPFFISKFELTAAQRRIASDGSPDSFRLLDLPDAPDPRLPATNLSALDCDRLVLRLGLTLPTEAQWEYAARAALGPALASHWPWSTGATLDTLEGFANLFDLDSNEAQPYWRRQVRMEPVPWHDGNPFITRVGSYAANHFGLHDVHGNAMEWCSNYPYDYASGDVFPGNRVARGGDSRSDAFEARLTRRRTGPPQLLSGSSGCRPAREIAR